MARTFRIRTRIDKPIAEVFEAIIQQELLKKYFCDSASGDIVAGERVVWSWENHGDYPVQVVKVEPNHLIVFTLNGLEWQKSGEDYDVTVTMELEALDDGATMLSISEADWPDTEDGISGSYDNCEGWTHMAMCLKAFLEHGIDLR